MKVVLRIALEHLKHGGIDNGKLPVTYQDSVRWGVRKNSVHEALLVAVNLGSIDRTSTGDVPWHGDIRRPSTFGLTWLPQYDGVPPSNRWKRIKTDLEAKAAIKQAKKELAQLRRLPPFFKKQTPTPKHATWPGNDPATCPSSNSPLGDSNSSQFPSNDSGTPFYISGYPATDANTATRNRAGGFEANPRSEDASTAAPRMYSRGRPPGRP